jgi:hypothetical protein
MKIYLNICILGLIHVFPMLFVAADISWSIGTKFDPTGYSGGAHGYNNSNIFYAEGPYFRKGFVNPPFENMDIYPMIARLLSLESVETVGNLENVRDMFVK